MAEASVVLDEDAVELRSAVPADYPAYAALFAELGIPDPVPSAERFAAAIAAQLTVACRDGHVVGFCSWRPYGTLAHVVQLAVAPQLRGQRIGERLLRHVRELARAAGCTRWYLNVKRDNTAALRLYERVGLTRELASTVLAIAWSRVPARAVLATLATPEEDPQLAARFGVPVERLAMFRAAGARGVFHLIALRAGGELAGLAAFDPDVPIAAVFRTSHPALAADLLAAMRPYARPAHELVRLMVEGAAPLAEELVALGAEITFELWRLSGPL